MYIRRALTAFALAAAPCAALADPVSLIWAGPAPEKDSQVQAINLMADYLERAAPGEFDLQVFGGGTLVNQAGVLPSLQTGAIQMTYLNAFDVSSLVPEYGALTAAYSVRDPLHMCSVLNGRIGADFSAAMEDKVGVVSLGATLFGMRHVALRKAKEVNTPADLDGVKQREPNSEAWQLQGRAVGATPTPLALNELFLAMQTGTVDAHSLPLPSSYNFKLHEVTEQVVLTGHYVNHLVLVINADAWNGMTERQQALLQEAADVGRIFNDRAKVRDEMELRTVFEEAGVTFTTPDIPAFMEHAAQTYAASDFAKSWKAGLAEEMMATPSDNPKCFHLMPEG